MKKKEWFYIFAFGLVVVALYYTKEFYDFNTNYYRDFARYGVTSWQEHLFSPYTIRRTIGVFILAVFSSWFLVKLFQLFGSENKNLPETSAYKKPYLIEFFKSAGIYALAAIISTVVVLWLIPTLKAVRSGYRMDPLESAFMMVNLIFFLGILAIPWAVFSVYIFFARRKNFDTTKGFRIFMYTTLVLTALGLVEFLASVGIIPCTICV